MVSCVVGALAEALEFPLAFSHLGIDAFVVDACVEANIKMLFNDASGDVTHRRVACATVVFTLRGRIAIVGPT